VTTATVNFRSGPGTGYASFGSIDEGSQLVVSECHASGAWCAVKFSGKDGFINGSRPGHVASHRQRRHIDAFPTYGIGAFYNPAYGTFGRYGYAYGPYRGFAGGAAYNPRTRIYVRGGAVTVLNRSRGVAAAYNPRAGNAALAHGGSNVYGSWGTPASGIRRQVWFGLRPHLRR
jgi:hypothetical protein